MVKNIYKAVVAFADMDGGIVCIDVDDQGDVTGSDKRIKPHSAGRRYLGQAIVSDVPVFTHGIFHYKQVIRFEESMAKEYKLK